MGSGGDYGLRAFVLSPASGPAVTAAVGDGVVPLPPENPFALSEGAVPGPGAGPVLIAGTESQEYEVRRHATLATARWPELQVAWRAVPAAVLAVANGAAMAARSGLEPGLAVRYFDLVLERTWSGAWVRSVARLSGPVPTLGQHLRSWLPGAGFLMLHPPRSKVLSVTDLAGVAAPVPSERRSMLLVGGAPPQRVTTSVMAMAGATAHHTVAAVADAERQYGTRHAVELVGAPFRLADGALQPTGECPSCSLRLATPGCPFCHATADSAGSVRRAG